MHDIPTQDILLANRRAFDQTYSLLPLERFPGPLMRISGPGVDLRDENIELDFASVFVCAEAG